MKSFLGFWSLVWFAVIVHDLVAYGKDGALALLLSALSR